MTEGASSKVSELWRTLPALIRHARVRVDLNVGTSTTCLVTGLGGSEWPARVFEWSMRAGGKACEFVPLSRFLSDAPAAETLVVFSQYLSNNVAFVLRAANAYRRVVMVSALDEDRCRERFAALDVNVGDFDLVTVETPDERSFLFRPVGPALMASVGVSCVLAHLGLEALPVSEIATVYARPQVFNKVDDASNAVLSLGRDAGIAAALAWKANEALGRPVPSWDAVGFAHGGFQAIFELPKFEALLLRPDLGVGRAIEDGIVSMLGGQGHTVRAFGVDVDERLAPYAYDAAFTSYLLERLQRSERNLEKWPGKGCDGAMYNLVKVDGA